ncbi:MAG: SulP family inorganic anion transporter, partial [Sedimentisphaerales bacterium]|nr:SulP family inorganic anion transporter [Sedimentisphaerales bacterium]
MNEYHPSRAGARILPGLAVLRRYDRSWLRYDIVAGFSVAAVAVPVAIAYSQLAGLPPVYGLYASILPLLAYALFGTSRQLILAPDAATCTIVAAIILPMAAGDAERAVSLAMTLAVITGAFCIVAGCLRLGFLTNFLARPILAGYLNGIALAIVVGQFGKMLGFALPHGGIFRQLAAVAGRFGETHLPTLAVAGTTVALLLVLKRLSPRLPGPLVAVALGIAASLWLGLDGRGVTLLGSIPAGLPRPALPAVSLDDLERLAYGALGLALISFNSA